MILNRLYKDYQLPLELYLRLKQSIKYNYHQNHDDLNEFIQDLPKNLAIEVSLFIHEGTYKKIDFLKNNSSESFLAWICPLLKPEIISPLDYVYFEGDNVTCMYFLKHGECGFVLPRHSNIKYIEIKSGNFFGIIDIVGSMLTIEAEDFENWNHYKEKLKR